MKNDRSVYRILAAFSQFTIQLLVPIFMCAFVGYYIDQKFHTSWFFILFFFVGALAGLRNLFVLAGKLYDFKKGDPFEDGKEKD